MAPAAAAAAVRSPDTRGGGGAGGEVFFLFLIFSGRKRAPGNRTSTHRRQKQGYPRARPFLISKAKNAFAMNGVLPWYLLFTDYDLCKISFMKSI